MYIKHEECYFASKDIFITYIFKKNKLCSAQTSYLSQLIEKNKNNLMFWFSTEANLKIKSIAVSIELHLL